MEQEERNIDRMIEQLRKQYRLSSTEQEIASYVLTHLQTMPAMTVRDLAHACYASTSAVMRFIKKIGYQSFPDFKYRIDQKMKELGFQQTSTETKLDRFQWAEHQAKIIQKTIEAIDEEQFDRWRKVLCYTAAIDWIADDTNAALAQYGMHLCWGTGKCGQVFSDTDLQMNASLMIPDDHVVVVMSKYGLKERWQSVLEHYKKRHVPVLLIAGGRLIS